MALMTNRRTFLGALAWAVGWLALRATGQTTRNGGGPRGGRGGGGGRRSEYPLPADLAAYGALSVVLGRVSDRSVTVSVLAKEAMEGYIEYGTDGTFGLKTQAVTLPAGAPVEVALGDLHADTAYGYRLQLRPAGAKEFTPKEACRFHTQRAAGRTFTFAVQGDSHPERPQMSHPELYARTLRRVAESQPDFYVCMGDDFSIERLRTFTAETVGERYLLQRPFLGVVGQAAPVFLLNGNHEQASLYNYNQTGMAHDAAVAAANARNKYFPLPATDGFYTGDAEEFKGIGLLRDYYAWTWGDALFVVLDNYWHSPASVDSVLGEPPPEAGPPARKDRDWWAITLGDAQYKWLKKTLEESKAKHKFVFAHHVLGTGRGGVDECDLFEWGGKNKRGDDEFKTHRPGWDLPIHQLMAKHNVTIFFQGHDHLYARQERDGVVYQEVPMPADHGYVAYNEERYGSGVKLPNSGYLRVTVSPEQVKVEYVRCWLAQDETEQHQSGEVAHSYTIPAQVKHG